jgi:hypothetical protein
MVVGVVAVVAVGGGTHRAQGMPLASTAMEHCGPPPFPRSTGLGPAFSPPQGALGSWRAARKKYARLDSRKNLREWIMPNLGMPIPEDVIA